MSTSYDELMSKYEDIVVASSIRGVLIWDIETGKIPSKGVEHRSKQLSYLTKQQQTFWRSDHVTNLLDKLQNQELNPFQQRNVDLIRREHRVKNQINQELLTELSSQSNKTNSVWKKAKNNADFSQVKEEMEHLFELNKQYADQLADIKDMNSAFDALIDERDEGLTSDQITKYFSEARDFLVPFIDKHSREKSDKHLAIHNTTLTKDTEMQLARIISDLFQYPYAGDNARGSIDEVEHPLTISCGPDDIRITVKFGDFIKVINSTNHELGHGIHGLRKNHKWRYLPVNNFGGPTIGECTSRYTENKIGKSYEYYVHLFPEIKDIVGYKFNGVNLDDFYDTITLIEPGTSRMRADEVTYGIHIIIRYELEQLLFDDKLTISELPQAWNEKYEEYLGVEVPNDTAGVMQDLHWFNVYYGYFHGYFMGDLIGSQFHSYMETEIPNWKEDLASGDLNDVLAWFTENIYAKGAMYPPLDHVKEITGEKLNVDYFKTYIETKYNEF